MARHNLNGTSFKGLNLEKDEESILKKHLEHKGWSAVRYIRYLIRNDLNLKPKLDIKHGKEKRSH